jgi:hypothetical protein
MMMTPKSGLFLAVSCIAAIAAVGSGFELSSGEPELGTSLTWGILGLCGPLTIVALLLAIQDARRANQ